MVVNVSARRGHLLANLLYRLMNKARADGVLALGAIAAESAELSLSAMTGSTLGGFVPLVLVASYWRWGIGGVWAGLTAFIVVRLVGMVWRARTDRWLVLGSGRMSA